MSCRLLIAAAFAGIVAIPVLAADLSIEVRGVRSADGRVYVAVHGPESKDTSRASITTDPIGPGPVTLSTSSAANAGCGRGSTPNGSADDATASLPWRARLRHVDNCQRDIP